MTHENARLLLEQADNPRDRQEAVRAAIDLGMPLHEIEQYLDWLDLVRSTRD
jgi:DNA-binding transcriptional MerR regulator